MSVCLGLDWNGWNECKTTRKRILSWLEIYHVQFAWKAEISGEGTAWKRVNHAIFRIRTISISMRARYDFSMGYLMCYYTFFFFVRRLWIKLRLSSVENPIVVSIIFITIAIFIGILLVCLNTPKKIGRWLLCMDFSHCLIIIQR